MMPLWRRSALLLLLLMGHLAAGAGDAEALLRLKSSLDHFDRPRWRPDTAAGLCSSWAGVRQCDGHGRVTKLVLEGLNLTGSLTAALLAPLGELRVLSLKSNYLTGPIPDAFPPNLKLLYLADNRLEGRIPASLALLHRATVIVLSGNRLSGQIPASLAAVPRLTSLLLDRNLLTGPIPPLRQRTLRLLNVSNNRLSGEIPESLATRFNASSFLPNAGLCGPPLATNCNGIASAPLNAATAAAFAPLPAPGSRRSRGRRGTIVAAATVAGAVVLGILVAAAVMASRSRRGRNNKTRDAVVVDVNNNNNNKDLQEEEEEQQQRQPPPTGGVVGAGVRDFSWEREGIGKLVFCGGVSVTAEMYSLEELLRASAETLGRGEVGSTYKAVMETGFIVTVKRMRDPSSSSAPMDFGRRAEELGRVRHPNVVPLRAYFQAKEERLLVYDYYPNGSLFALVHGSRPSSKGKPLHWTSCMKIAEDVAAATGAPPPVAAGWHRARQPQAVQRPPRPGLRVMAHRLRTRPNDAPRARRRRCLFNLSVVPGPGGARRSPRLHAGFRGVQLRGAPPGAPDGQDAVPGPHGAARRRHSQLGARRA